MRTNPFILVVTIALLSLFDLCAYSGPPAYAPEIVQGKDTFLLKDGLNVLHLKKEPFEFIFYSRPYDNSHLYSTRIASFANSTSLDSISEGMSIDDVPYFSPGTGNATKGIYDDLYVDNGNNYIIYDLKDEKRATLLKKEDDDYLQLKWGVSKIVWNEKEFKIQNLKLKKLYLVIFNDKNLNNKADKDEFYKVEIDFE